LIIDIYGGTAVIQCHSAGMYNSRDQITEALRSLTALKLRAVFDKSAETVRNSGSQGETQNGFLWGPGDFETIKENDLKFKVDFQFGQKTGFFLDQRENRLLVRRYAAGRRVLNTFAYSGAFSVYALAGGAKSVTSVEISEQAAALLEENVKSNFPAGENQTVRADCFDFLNDPENRAVYDLIVLDPPAFAKHKSGLKGAQKGYGAINTQAFSLLNSNGLLFTFSCSQLLSRDDFKKIVLEAAVKSGRTVRVLHELRQAPCHPVSIYHPEGEYLKGLVLGVE
jgi:23S rRNA (cytosine1962-C5)-methyltransferase